MLYAIVAVIALLFDQLLKYWTTVHIVENTGVVPLIPGFIHLTHIHNTGAAFSFLEGARWFFVVLCVVFVAVVVWLLAKNILNTPGTRWCAVIVVAGALGNAIDRVLTGYVVDMIEFEFVSFPIYNLADIYITLGVIGFCICLLAERPAKKRAHAGDDAKEPKSRKLKAELSVFPKPENPQSASGNSEDPFAAWERMAASRTPAQSAAGQSATSDAGPVIYSQPKAGEILQMSFQSDRAPVQTAAQNEQPAFIPEQSKPETPLPRPVNFAAEKKETKPTAAQEKAPRTVSKTEHVMRILVSGTPEEENTPAPAFPAPAAPAAQAVPTAPPVSKTPPPASAPGAEASVPEFDLDSILAEFQDL